MPWARRTGRGGPLAYQHAGGTSRSRSTWAGYERRRLAELERENRELRRANEILKAASAFFARELDPRLPR